jgi:hypothetical protein
LRYKQENRKTRKETKDRRIKATRKGRKPERNK